MNDCPHCDDMRERIAWLESELGLQRHAALLDKIRRALAPGSRNSKARGAAALIAALYAAQGRPMSIRQLMEALPARDSVDERNSNVISVWVHAARRHLGKATIANVWGHGYRLSDEGMARVGALVDDKVKEALTARSPCHAQGAA